MLFSPPGAADLSSNTPSSFYSRGSRRPVFSTSSSAVSLPRCLSPFPLIHRLRLLCLLRLLLSPVPSCRRTATLRTFERRGRKEGRKEKCASIPRNTENRSKIHGGVYTGPILLHRRLFLLGSDFYSLPPLLSFALALCLAAIVPSLFPPFSFTGINSLSRSGPLVVSLFLFRPLFSPFARLPAAREELCASRGTCIHESSSLS